MDSGWAVVLGAVIALTGSALLPWWREVLADRRRSAQEAMSRRSDAIVELLAWNSALSMAGALKDAERVQGAYESRQRAMIRLLLECEDEERSHVSKLLKNSVPILTTTNTTTPGQMASALQDIVLEWAAGDLAAEDLYSRFLARAKPKKDDAA